MRIAELHDSYGRRVMRGISAKINKTAPSQAASTEPTNLAVSFCVKLYEQIVTCQGQFKGFRKILVTGSIGSG